MNWELHLRERAKRTIRRFPEKDRVRIAEALDELGSNPYSGDIEKLEGEKNSWRRRVGAYRIKYEVHAHEKMVYVYHVERRTSKTY